MNIAPIFSRQLESSFRRIIHPKRSDIKSVNKSSSGDSVSFRGHSIFLSGDLSDINANKFPDDLYLNLDDVFETFENEDRTYHRWENFRFILCDLLAKRCNHIGLTKRAKSLSVGSIPVSSYGYPRSEILSIDENTQDKNYNDRSIDFNWTREYHELEEFFRGIPGKSFGAESDMQKIRNGLPAILREQGWIK